MRSLRALTRLLLIKLLTLGFLVLLLGGLVLALPFPRLRARWRSLILRLWSRSLLCVLGVRVEVSGEPPRAPFLLVANHLSYLDILVLGSVVGPTFVAKSEIADWPVIGMLCRSVNTIFVDRSLRRDLPRVMRCIDAELRLGQGVVLFAEGTSSQGATVLPLRPSLLEPAVRTQLPVACAALGYRTVEPDKPAYLTVCWWGGRGFIEHALAFLRLQRVDASLVFGKRVFPGSDRKALAEEIREAILEVFAPLCD